MNDADDDGEVKNKDKATCKDKFKDKDKDTAKALTKPKIKRICNGPQEEGPTLLGPGGQQ